jgi:hypothetical protein
MIRVESWTVECGHRTSDAKKRPGENNVSHGANDGILGTQH